MSNTEHICDAVVIGAGLTGISAARTLESYNGTVRKEDKIKYVVLEANDKIGGRVQSEVLITPEGKKVKVEKGAAWMHVDVEEGAPENHLLKHIPQADHVHDDMAREFWDNGHRVKFNGNIERINRAREIIRQYHGKDIDLATLFSGSDLGEDASALVTTFGPVETGVSLDKMSVEDARELVSCNMGEFSRKPLADFIKNYAKPVASHIELNTPVSRICWKSDGGKGVEIHTKDGQIYHAKRVIITVSVGVLKSGDITFEPPLPKEYQDSLSHIKMGDFNKIFILFDSKFKFPVNANTHLDVRTKPITIVDKDTGESHKDNRDIFYLARNNGQPLVTAFMGDDLARLCDHDPDQAKAVVIQGLKEIWGDRIESSIVQSKATQWGNEPFVRGGYSRVDVGYHHVREALAKPIEDTLYLAGEALGARHPATGRNWATHMAGAALSGERAANAVIQAREKEHPVPYRRFIATDTGNAQGLA